MDEEGYVRSIMSELNRNLATERITIERMVDEGISSYKVRDGSTVEVPREQIDFLWDVCSRLGAYNLRIPIYVTTDTAGEQGSWRVDGRMESDVVAEILGKRKTRDDSVRLHFPDYRELRRTIPDLVMVVFAPRKWGNRQKTPQIVQRKYWLSLDPLFSAESNQKGLNRKCM